MRKTSKCLARLYVKLFNRISINLKMTNWCILKEFACIRRWKRQITSNGMKKKSQNEQVTKLHSSPNWFSTCLDEIAQHKKPVNQVSERTKFSYFNTWPV